MKLLILFFPLALMAQYIELIPARYFPVGKDNAVKEYVSKALCEEQEGQACYDISGHNLAYEYIKNGKWIVDNKKKQKFLKGN